MLLDGHVPDSHRPAQLGEGGGQIKVVTPVQVPVFEIGLRQPQAQGHRGDQQAEDGDGLRRGHPPAEGMAESGPYFAFRAHQHGCEPSAPARVGVQAHPQQVVLLQEARRDRHILRTLGVIVAVGTARITEPGQQRIVEPDFSGVADARKIDAVRPHRVGRHGKAQVENTLARARRVQPVPVVGQHHRTLRGSSIHADRGMRLRELDRARACAGDQAASAQHAGGQCARHGDHDIHQGRGSRPIWVASNTASVRE
jgi:hypothetical protein